MKVEVKFIGATKILAGINEAVLYIDGEPTVKEVLALVNQEYLKHKLLDKNGRVAYPCIIGVNGKMIRNCATDLYERLSGNATIVFSPPPAGG